MLFGPILFLSLAAGSLAKSSFRRSPSRPAREHRRVARQCPPQPAGGPTPTGTPNPQGGPGNPLPYNSTGGSGGKYKLEVMFKGEDFFNKWDFCNSSDPTHGAVNYQDKTGAQSKHLAYTEGDVAVLAADDTTALQAGQKRDSVRITSQQKWNGGLFIADFVAMPFGCSLWPAYWSVGPDWPNSGEIDVAEGVNNQTHNQYTLHTAEGKDGCKASTSNVQISGTPGQTTQCATINGDNTGCAYLDTDNRSYGEGFNQAGGGVFAHLWNQDGIKAWHFARDEVPADIKSGSPDPSTWGPPAAFWSSQTCNIPEHFHDHQLVIDTTLCGDWAGAAYMDSGCPGKSCGDAVADPNNFTNAKWKINTIAVYQAA